MSHGEGILGRLVEESGGVKEKKIETPINGSRLFLMGWKEGRMGYLVMKGR